MCLMHVIISNASNTTGYWVLGLCPKNLPSSQIVIISLVIISLECRLHLHRFEKRDIVLRLTSTEDIRPVSHYNIDDFMSST